MFFSDSAEEGQGFRILRNFDFGKKKMKIVWKALFALLVTARGERVTLVVDGDGEALSKKIYHYSYLPESFKAKRVENFTSKIEPIFNENQGV